VLGKYYALTLLLVACFHHPKKVLNEGIIGRLESDREKRLRYPECLAQRVQRISCPPLTQRNLLIVWDLSTPPSFDSFDIRRVRRRILLDLAQ
jgi:hypothetical protein